MKKIIANTNFLIFIILLAWGSAYVAIRIGLHGFSPGSMGFLRFFIASITLLPFYINDKHKVKLSTFHLTSTVLLGIFGIGLYTVILNYAELTTSSSMTSFIISQSPVIMVILAIIFFDEKINIGGTIGIIISFCGICLISFSKSNGWHFDAGMIFVCTAAIISALYSVLQKPLFAKVPAMQVATITIWSGTAAMAIFIPQLLQELPNANLSSTIAVIYLGVVPGAIGYLAWSLILAKIPAVKAAGYLYVIPLITTIMGFFIGEFPVFLSLLGGVIALTGTLITHFSKIKLLKKTVENSIN